MKYLIFITSALLVCFFQTKVSHLEGSTYEYPICKISLIKDSILNNRIAYESPESIEQVFGNRFVKRLRVDADADYPSVYYTSKNKKEYLRCMVFPGNACCQFFEVGYMIDLNSGQKTYHSRFKGFCTNNNVKLGISKEELFRLISKDYLTKKVINDYEIYEREEGKYNADFYPDLSEYIARYKFKNNILVAFGFGRNFPNFNPLIID
jgi:hypothetical protein